MSEETGVWPRLIRVAARRRVTLGFLGGALVLWLAAPTVTTILASLPVAVAGEAIRIWAAGHLNKAREVTRSGPYRFVAHPLYLGSSVLGASLAIASWSLAVTALVATYLVVTLTAAIRSEEASLKRLFGDQYTEYREARVVDRERRFSFARAIANREHRAVTGLLVAFLLLVLKATYNGALRAQPGG